MPTSYESQKHYLLAYIAGLLLFGPGLHHAQGAALFTETFAADSADWGNAGTGPNWIHTNGSMRVSFDEQMFPMPEEAAALAAGAASSGGAFVGNYRAAGAQLIGFDFYANIENPAQLILELVSGTNTYRRNLFDKVGPAGNTSRIAVSLVNRQAGGWDNLVGSSDASFESVLTNVTAVFVKLSRGSLVAHEYRVDNFFLDALPVAGTPQSMADGASLTWIGVRPGWLYHLEATTNLVNSADWTGVVTVTATNQVISLLDPSATNHAFRAYRLVMP